MRYRKLDANKDMTFGNQQADFYRNVPDASAQAIDTRLRLLVGEWYGEWYLDLEEGTPMQTRVLGKGTLETAEPTIRDRILNTQGVDSIESFSTSFNPDTRVFSYQAVVETIYGTITMTGVL
jgi:hypothetical protein